MSNFWRSLDLPLINCEIELDLKWTKNCVSIEEDNHITVVSFMITNTKLCVPVVILSINDNIKFLENTKQGFKRTTQPKNNNLDYLIGPTFRNINRLFVISFKKVDGDPTRSSFVRYYMSLIDFNVLIDNKPFFDQPVKNKQKLTEMSRNDDYTTGNLLDFSYHQNY